VEGTERQLTVEIERLVDAYQRPYATTTLPFE
jgi:hypothetical protein